MIVRLSRLLNHKLTVILWMTSPNEASFFVSFIYNRETTETSAETEKSFPYNRWTFGSWVFGMFIKP